MIKNKILQTISEYKLIEPGDKILVAVSGGADSIALLNLLYTLKNELKIKLHIAHLNHLLRKRDAELDLRYVQTLGQNLAIPVTVESFDVAEFARENKLSLETAARQARYDFLNRVAGQVKANKIALGHSADDNVETFLMRLLRGAGSKGLCGIPPRRGNIIRPLIKTWRREVEDYVGSLKLVPRRDYTNYESRFLRNRVRMKLIPQLRIYNLRIKEIILQTILLLTQDNIYLEQKAEEALQAVSSNGKGPELKLAINKLLKLDEAIQSHLIRLAIERVKGDLLEISYKHIKDVLAKLADKEKWQLHLPDNIFISGGRDSLVISRTKPHEEDELSYNYELPIPGEIEIPELKQKIRASFVSKKDLNDDSTFAFLDHDYLSKGLLVRNRLKGDRFYPLGLRRAKKLQDFFVDEKVAAEQRLRTPIVVSGKDIVWIAGMRIDERAKVKKNTKKIVKIELL